MDEITRREAIRGMILKGAQQNPQRQLADEAIKYMLRGYGYEMSKAQVRHEMEYLSGKYLVEVKKKNSNLWFAKLTSFGVDVLEGRQDVEGVILGD